MPCAHNWWFASPCPKCEAVEAEAKGEEPGIPAFLQRNPDGSWKYRFIEMTAEESADRRRAEYVRDEETGNLK